jgi:chromosome segregation ATPase
LKPYKDQVEELRRELVDTQSQLVNARLQVTDLASKLFEAQTELGALRLQIKTMSSEFRDEGQDGKV